MYRLAAVAAASIVGGILPTSALAAPAPFRVGAAVANIDPSYPVYMGGYGGGPAGGTLSTTTAPQVFARAWFSPFIHHTYRSPGAYNLTVTAADQHGQTDTMTLPIHVYPALRVRIVRRGCSAIARITGGDGTVLSRRWARAHGSMEVTVTDAAGGIATASTHWPAAVCEAPSPWRTP